MALRYALSLLILILILILISLSKPLRRLRLRTRLRLREIPDRSLTKRHSGQSRVLTQNQRVTAVRRMARKLRVEYEGAIYHLINRGDRRETIFKDDEDRHLFLKTLGQACAQTDWQVYAWRLMSNHLHMVIETPQPNLVAGMKWFPGTYTARFNRRHRLAGHLFAGRYKALIVDGSGSFRAMAGAVIRSI
jgi:REP element-mobilizing transposase RayT